MKQDTITNALCGFIHTDRLGISYILTSRLLVFFFMSILIFVYWSYLNFHATHFMNFPLKKKGPCDMTFHSKTSTSGPVPTHVLWTIQNTGNIRLAINIFYWKVKNYTYFDALFKWINVSNKHCKNTIILEASLNR